MDVEGKEIAVFGDDRPQRQIDGQLVAVPVDEPPAMTALEIGAVGDLRQAVVEIVILAQVDDGRNRVADDLVLAPSDEEFGGLVPVDDHAVAVEGDHRVHRGIDDVTDQQLAAAEAVGLADVLDGAAGDADVGNHDHQVEGEDADGQRALVGVIG